MSKARDKSNKVVNVCHLPFPTQKNQSQSRVTSTKVTDQSDPSKPPRKATSSVPSITDLRWQQPVILPRTLWHMFRTAKITRSLSYRKCGTGCSIATHMATLPNRITRKLATFHHYQHFPRTTQDSMVLKIPCSILHARRTTFKLVSTTSVISMKKNFKYFTKSKRSIRKYGQLSPF